MLPAYPLGEHHAALQKRARGRSWTSSASGTRANSKVEWLSGGEAQRTAIARALINDPRIIIADEPTAHLDTKLSREFMDIVARLKTEKKTVIIASHDPLVYECSRRRPGRHDARRQDRGESNLILHPAIIALLVSSVLMSFLALYSAYYGAAIVRRWDLTSGSSLQLDLERRTYLISTILAYVFAFQLASLFLFVFTDGQPLHALHRRHVRGGDPERQPVRLSGPGPEDPELHSRGSLAYRKLHGQPRLRLPAHQKEIPVPSWS